MPRSLHVVLPVAMCGVALILGGCADNSQSANKHAQPSAAPVTVTATESATVTETAPTTSETIISSETVMGTASRATEATEAASPTPAVTPRGMATASQGECSWPAMEDADGGQPAATYCDGQWAQVGLADSGVIEYLRFEDGEWLTLESDGQTATGFSCYDVARWEAAGAPPEITTSMIPCE